MPLPDNFDTHAFNRAWGDVSYDVQAALDEYSRTRCAIENTIMKAGQEAACAGFGPLTEHEEDCLRESLAEMYWRQLEHSRNVLGEAGVTIPNLYKAEA